MHACLVLQRGDRGRDLCLGLAHRREQASVVRDRRVTVPSVPMMMRHRPPGNLDLRARKDHRSHAHAPETDRGSGR